MLVAERTREARAVSQARPAARKVIIRILLCLFLLTAGMLNACTRPASINPVVNATSSVPGITIENVQVNQGAGVYVTGRSTLPSGECIQTELEANGKIADWWPRNVCVTVETGQWEMLAALGRKGAPERLEPGVKYEIHAWWPKNPTQTTARFPFELNEIQK